MTLVPWWLIFIYVTGCHSRIYKHGSSWNGYEFHTYPHPAKKPIIPRDIMVDVINNLGLKLLAIHNEYNENNIAISPYGALSVLVALGEGLEGEAVFEIKQATHLPSDISIIRVGLRDIHRHLKSYFIPKEGFLAGLTLNHENVTLRPEYEEILKFYGYDTVSFNNALFPQPETTEMPQTTSISQITTTEQTTESSASTIMGKAEPEGEMTTETTCLTTDATTETATITAKMSTTTEAYEKTSEIPTQEIPTTIYSSSVSTLPPTTTTEIGTVEPKTLAITTPYVPPTIYETTTGTAFSSTREVTTPNPTTTPAITTSSESALSSVTPEQTTAPPIRTTRDMPTTAITITESATLASSTEQPSFSSTVMKDITTEYTTTQNVLTSLADTTTNLPSTTLTVTQNVVTPLSETTTDLPDTTLTATQNVVIPLADTTTDLPGTTFTVTQNIVTTILPATSTLTPLPLTSTEQITTKDGTDTTVKELLTLPTTEPTLFESTKGSPGDDPLSTLTPSIFLSTNTPNEPTTTTDLTSTEISTTDSKVNEIDATDVSSEMVGFGGVTKRKARAGEVLTKGSNVVELNMRQEKEHKLSKRNKRSVFDYIIARYYDDQYLLHHRHQRPYVPKEELSFLIYGKYREYNVNFMKYDTVLPFYYVPHLDSMALSFPLDSTKYYLLLLLPVDETGIDKLVCDLRLNGSLKYIIANLRYTHVVATIPSFTLKGYITLTPSFQKLGIRKVFEPRQADFTPMTNQSQIYVTNIEQAITVTIRNYVDPDTIHNYRNLHQYNPVHFKADHPFLYFVIDTEIHVTLMAGKIVNPLNSRIS